MSTRRKNPDSNESDDAALRMHASLPKEVVLKAQRTRRAKWKYAGAYFLSNTIEADIYLRYASMTDFAFDICDKFGNEQHGGDGANSMIITTMYTLAPLHPRSRSVLKMPTLVKCAQSEDSDFLIYEFCNQIIAWHTFNRSIGAFVEPYFIVNNNGEMLFAHHAIHTVHPINTAFYKTNVPTYTASQCIEHPRSFAEFMKAWFESARVRPWIFAIAEYVLFLLLQMDKILIHGDLHSNNVLLDTLGNRFDKPVHEWSFVEYRHIDRVSGLAVSFMLPARVYLIDLGRSVFAESISSSLAKRVAEERRRVLRTPSEYPQVTRYLKFVNNLPNSDFKWFSALLSNMKASIVPKQVRDCFQPYSPIIKPGLMQADVIDVFRSFIEPFLPSVPEHVQSVKVLTFAQVDAFVTPRSTI